MTHHPRSRRVPTALTAVAASVTVVCAGALAAPTASATSADDEPVDAGIFAHRAQADKSSLERAFAEAASVGRDRYSESSLRSLDDAVAVGEVVLAGSKATAADVKAATKLVGKAIHQLKKVKK